MENCALVLGPAKASELVRDLKGLLARRATLGDLASSDIVGGFRPRVIFGNICLQWSSKAPQRPSI
jgi:hypothetical protein